MGSEGGGGHGWGIGIGEMRDMGKEYSEREERGEDSHTKQMRCWLAIL